jgi:hypothetical protein
VLEGVLRDGRFELEAVVAAEAMEGEAGGAGIDGEVGGRGIGLAVGDDLGLKAAFSAGGEVAAMDGDPEGVSAGALRGLVLEVDEAGPAEACGDAVRAGGAAGLDLRADEAEQAGFRRSGLGEPDGAPADAGFARLEIEPGDVEAEEQALGGEVVEGLVEDLDEGAAFRLVDGLGDGELMLRIEGKSAVRCGGEREPLTPARRG